MGRGAEIRVEGRGGSGVRDEVRKVEPGATLLQLGGLRQQKAEGGQK